MLNKSIVHYIYISFTMFLDTVSPSQLTSDAFNMEDADGMDSLNELLNTNWQTTAAVGLTVASGGVLGAISLAAFPAQTLAASTGIGVLAYAGKRRADGKDALPFLGKKSDDQTEAKTQDKAEATEPAAA